MFGFPFQGCIKKELAIAKKKVSDFQVLYELITCIQ